MGEQLKQENAPVSAGGHASVKSFLGKGLRVAAITTLAFVMAACSVSPTPFTPEELDAFAADKRRRAIAADQTPVTGRIDLYEAMARALKYNLDHRLEMSEVALRYAELGDGEFDMLPDLVARIEWADRSNLPFSTSLNTAGIVSGIPTTSEDPGSSYSNLELSWDILDYGLSYYRSKQNADRVMIAEEQRRSTINRVIEDVRTAYWRAVAAERLMGPLAALETRAERALDNAREQVASVEGDQLEALRYQREMYETLQRAQSLRRDLSVAKNQLAALMNLPQNQDFSVVIPRQSDLRTPITAMTSEQMTEMALRNRPEMREIAYRLRINEVDEDAAALELLPSIRGYVGLNYDFERFPGE